MRYDEYEKQLKALQKQFEYGQIKKPFFQAKVKELNSQLTETLEEYNKRTHQDKIKQLGKDKHDKSRFIIDFNTSIGESDQPEKRFRNWVTTKVNHGRKNSKCPS